MRAHKHEGVLTSTGAMRSHPITRNHSKDVVKVGHNASLKGSDIGKFLQGDKKALKSTQQKPKVVTQERVATKEGIVCQLDKDGFINIDLRSADVKGIRVVFQRTEGRTKRRVGLQINK